MPTSKKIPTTTRRPGAGSPPTNLNLSDVQNIFDKTFQERDDLLLKLSAKPVESVLAERNLEQIETFRREGWKYAEILAGMHQNGLNPEAFTLKQFVIAVEKAKAQKYRKKSNRAAKTKTNTA